MSKLYWNHGSIDNGKRILNQGDEIPSGFMSPQEMKQYQAEGKISTTPRTKSNLILPEEFGETTNPENTPVGKKTDDAPGNGKEGNHPGKIWNFKPEELVGKNLEQLNMLVADHAKKSGVVEPKPFSVDVEARAWLTQDNE